MQRNYYVKTQRRKDGGSIIIVGELEDEAIGAGCASGSTIAWLAFLDALGRALICTKSSEDFIELVNTALAQPNAKVICCGKYDKCKLSCGSEL